jgi:hypothetical protein
MCHCRLAEIDLQLNYLLSHWVLNSIWLLEKQGLLTDGMNELERLKEKETHFLSIR